MIKYIVMISIIIVLFFIYQDNVIQVSKHSYFNSKIPKAFNNYRIVHISDFHNKMFGINQKYIINKIKKNNPDIIVVTGDLIDRRRFNLENALIFIKEAIKIAPIYYVGGNHEAWCKDRDIVYSSLESLGVNIINNSNQSITKQHDTIEILGLRDPSNLTKTYAQGTDLREFRKCLEMWSSNDFQILLSHRPEHLELYCKYNVDLVFTGHAHGGQIRIPFIGPILSPNQGLFPKYTCGSYTQNNTTMFVSRGLGNSVFPIRIFNRPEIIVVELKTK